MYDHSIRVSFDNYLIKNLNVNLKHLILSLDFYIGILLEQSKNQMKVTFTSSLSRDKLHRRELVLTNVLQGNKQLCLKLNLFIFLLGITHVYCVFSKINYNTVLKQMIH